MLFEADEFYYDDSWDWIPEVDPSFGNRTLDCCDVMHVLTELMLGAQREHDEGNKKYPGKIFYYNSFKHYQNIVEHAHEQTEEVLNCQISSMR